MNCPNCGSELEKDAKFCTNCGKSITPSEQPDITPSTTVIEQPTVNEPVVLQPNNIPQPTPPAKKKDNTVLIIVGVVVGVLALIVVGAIFAVSAFFRSVTNEINKYSDDTSIYDYSNSGNVVKTVVDPMNHEIRFVEDSVYVIKVDTDYLYDEADKLIENAKKISEDEIESLNATDVQKLALKKTIKLLSMNSYSKDDLAKRLEGEEFDKATINYAVENCGVDWDEQAKIQSYEILAAGGESKNDLISLLAYRGFDEAKVKQIVEKENFDFYEQAAYNASYYRFKYKEGISREEAERLLKFAKYSEAEIRYALKVVYDEFDD